MSSTKKPKKQHVTMSSTTAADDYNLCKAQTQRLRNHVVSCRDVPSDCGAMRVVLMALEKEEKRLDRDEKLSRKFASSDTPAKKAEKSAATTEKDATAGTKSSDDTKAAADDDEAFMEWEDATPQKTFHSDDDEQQTAVSPLGLQLATIAIRSTAQAGMLASSPVAAVALALHAALRSDVLGFQCTTGSPLPDSDSKSGFATPIRVLPKHKFVPDAWDAHAASSTGANVAFRYKKDGLNGTVILRVSLTPPQDIPPLDGNNMQVQFGITSSSTTETNEDSLKAMIFPVEDHINLSSLNKALSKSEKGVPPALHYKALPALLSKFCNTYDLGNVNDSFAVESSLEIPVVNDTNNSSSAEDGDSVNVSNAPHNNSPLLRVPDVQRPVFTITDDLGDGVGFGCASGIRPGDFIDDLAPAGIRDPLSFGEAGGVRPMHGGNLMGPNHPMFQRRGGYGNDNRDDSTDLFPGSGGMEMRPRFDPVYPPGLGGDIPSPGRNGGGRGRGRGGLRPPNSYYTGDPNPDHLRPPNNLDGGGGNGGGDMFM